jgi:hypothetical protein
MAQKRNRLWERIIPKHGNILVLPCQALRNTQSIEQFFYVANNRSADLEFLLF